MKPLKILVFIVVVVIILAIGLLFFKLFKHETVNEAVSYSGVIEGVGYLDGVPVKLAGVNVTLAKKTNQAVIKSATTDKEGYFRFDNLMPGRYIISFALSNNISNITYEYGVGNPAYYEMPEPGEILIDKISSLSPAQFLFNLKEVAKRDSSRYQILRLRFLSALHDYYLDHKSWPKISNDQVKENSKLIKELSPYLIKYSPNLKADIIFLNFSPMDYYSDGEQFKLIAYPELIFVTPLSQVWQDKNVYLLDDSFLKKYFKIQ